MSTQVTRRPDRTPLSQRDPVQLAEHFARSGFFKDAGDMSKAVVKIVAGEELGLGPMAAMQGIHIIDGKPSLSANVLAALVKKHPAYDYIVREHTEQVCRIEFLQNGEPIGTSEFSLEDAARAGLAGRQTWKRYPKALLFARTLSQGVRWYCPDVTAGSAAYVPEELGADTDAGGEPVNVAVLPANQVEPAPVDQTPWDEQPDEPEQVEDAVETIDAETVERFKTGFSKLELNIGQIAGLYGAAGLDGLRARSKKAVLERLEAMTPAEAELLEAELERVASNG